MIAIVNVGPTDKGRTRYEVRINQEIITTFKHRRSDGLAKCLERAADAVELHEMRMEDAVRMSLEKLLSEKKDIPARPHEHKRSDAKLSCTLVFGTPQYHDGRTT